MRNEEVRSTWSQDTGAGGWGGAGGGAGGGGGGAGGWAGGGDSGQTTPSKDWANSSAGSEVSPSSAWKKDTNTVGNWADDITCSPRDKTEENPLDVSLKEARRSLSNW